ncbi:hypothetical protein [Bradyrhizobium liaoningense]|uniref:hypothetical protein n=1 Tax=Bradyrhizobium liaoningense TaxID=43992 RepID=UPI001BAD9AB6|nr:hypothetical protein [Bradyrhizobium liaoningense]MBR0855459.1 hypothetical protein [Bradyrhizobium liaoningense]
MNQYPTHFGDRGWVGELAKRAREISVRSFEVLKMPVPDTFLGRKTQEPFAAEDPIERTDIRNLMHSELQPPKE